MEKWTIAVDGSERRVEYTEALVGAAATITVDGVQVPSKVERRLFAQTWRHIFHVNGHPFAVRVVNEMRGAVYSIGPLVDDAVPANVTPAWSVILAPVAALPLLVVSLRKGGFGLSMALPMLVGWAFIAIARSSAASARTRVFGCVAVAIGAWAVAGAMYALSAR